MLDITDIRERYAKMLDSQLIAIAQKDGHELTPAAFEILKEEFEKRGLDFSYITHAEENKRLAHQEKIEQFKAAASSDTLKAAWQYVINEKAAGTDDSAIITGLLERGIGEPEAMSIIANIKNKLKEMIDHASNRMLLGGGIFFLGSFITFYSYASAVVDGGRYVVVWGIILIGVIHSFRGQSEKAKYQRILKSIGGD
ncbi:hypothetical protein [Ferruginibacter sp.]